MFYSLHYRLRVATTTMVWLAVAAFALCPSPTTAVEADRMAEVGFESASAYANPFNEVALDAVFTTPEGKPPRGPAFWAGGERWRIRHASQQPGTHRSRPDDTAMPVVNSGQWGDQSPETYRPTGTTDLLYVAGGGIMANAPGRIAHGCEIVFKGGQVGRDSFFRELTDKNMNPK